MAASAPVHRLELRLRELAQLFNSLDPAPFLDRDLADDAEDYIESWAMVCATARQPAQQNSRSAPSSGARQRPAGGGGTASPQ